MNAVVKIKKAEWEMVLNKVAKLKTPEVSFLNTIITPDDAVKILQGNENNRHLNDYLIRKYTRLMNEDRWVLNGEVIKLAKDGRLLDGQHRMHAISKANKPVKVTLAFGLDHSHFKTIDTGRSRSAGDVLKIAGYKNVCTLAAAVKLMLVYENDEGIDAKASVCPEYILDGLKHWPKFTYFPSVAAPLKILPGSICVFMMYVTQHIDSDVSYTFFNKLLTGEKLGKTSPILMLRELLIKYKAQNLQLDKRYCLAFVINAWNAYYENVRVKTIKWQTGQGFPEIAGVNKKKLFMKNSLS